MLFVSHISCIKSNNNNHFRWHFVIRNGSLATLFYTISNICYSISFFHRLFCAPLILDGFIYIYRRFLYLHVQCIWKLHENVSLQFLFTIVFIYFIFFFISFSRSFDLVQLFFVLIIRNAVEDVHIEINTA